MEIVDAQVHTYERPSAERPWDPNFGKTGGAVMAAALKHAEETAVPRAEMVAAMDRCGIDAAILVATSHYGWDNGYSVEAAAMYPGRFAVVGRVNHMLADVDERVDAFKATPYAVGLRIIVVSDAVADQVRDGAYGRLLSACQEHGMPVCIFPPGYLPVVASLAEEFDGVQFIIDHLGLAQPPLMQPDPDPFQRVGELLDLARYENVAVKLTAAPTLSLQPYPYADLWPQIHRLIDAFGVDRLMWGTDWTRVSSVVSLEDGIRYLTDSDELDEASKTKLLAGNARRMFGWVSVGSPAD
jgi:predicted TIM-barrel fold metal-dependent hydrolase